VNGRISEAVAIMALICASNPSNPSVALAQSSGLAARKPLSDMMLSRVRPIIDALYRLDYPLAENLCQRIIHDYPDHPAGYVYCERVIFSKELSKARLLSAERAMGMDLFSSSPKFSLHIARETDAHFDATAEKATQMARLWISKYPDDLSGPYLLGSAYAFKSSYEVSIRQSRLSASGDASKTFKALKDLVRQHPDIVDARAITGVFRIVADSLDFKTKALALVFFGIHGDLEAGRRDMEDAAEHGLLEDDDARLLLSVLDTREKKFDQAMTRLSQLHEKYPENYLVHLEMAALDVISGKPAQALDTYRDILNRDYARLDQSVALCRLGVTSRTIGNLSQSEQWLREAVGTPAISTSSLSIASLELGKTLDLLGQRAGATEQYRRVLAGDDVLGTREDAKQWLARPYDRMAMKQDNRGGGLITLDDVTK
jgi:tetratricopeptide (TPR) repeat protein